MRVIVSAQALFDDGEVAWGYHHEENVIGEKAAVEPAELIKALREGTAPPEHAQEEMDRANRISAADTLEKLVEQIDAARESILRQAATEMLDRRE